MGGMGGLDHGRVFDYAERVHGWSVPDPDTDMRLQVCSEELVAIHSDRLDRDQRKQQEERDKQRRQGVRSVRGGR